MHSRIFAVAEGFWPGLLIENFDSADCVADAARPSWTAISAVEGRGDDQYIKTINSTSSSFHAVLRFPGPASMS
jgi:hypothetical protein